MQSNSVWRAQAAQTVLPSSTLLAGYILPELSRIQPWKRRLILRIAGVIALTALASGPVFAQKESGGYPEDWTHHHVVFSDPGTLHEASGRGSFDSWYKTITDPRFAIQRHRRGEHPHHGQGNQGPQTPPPLDRDWSAPLGGAGVAPGMYPAKWQFSVSNAPTCTDFVVFPVNQAGASGTQPNLVGYQNLYVNAGGTGFCPGTAPTILFSYFVGTGTVQTSPVLGYSAGQVAYVESIAGGSKFHVLTGAGTGASNGTVAAPVAPGTGNTATDVAVTLSGGVSVTRSSPFFDYSNDVAYVGDDNGKLHKFTPVFLGAPAEVTTGGWPLTVSTQVNKILTGPVRDGGTGMIFIGDSQGFLYSVSATNVVTASGQLGTGTGIVEPPMVDGYAQTVYVFVGDNAGSTASAVYLFDISSGNITAGGTGSNVTVGTNSATLPLYGGAFDNNYFSSANGTQPAGNLYVCGNTGGNPTLYKIPITYSGGPVLGSVVTGPVLASSNVACSPLTEFFNTNTSTDWLFGGVPGTSCGAGTGAGGCVMSFNITSAAPTIGPWTPSTAYTSTSEVVDTLGQLQKCTGGGCLIAGATSGTSTPAWTTGPGTTPDGTTTSASSIGTVNTNNNPVAAGQTVTIGTLTLTASTPTKAHSPILINAIPSNASTLTINGTTYDWHTTVGACVAGQKCVQRGGTTGVDATNLNNAIAGTCFTGACGTDPTVTGGVGGSTVTITAVIPGTGPNADVLSTNRSASIHINGGAHASTVLGRNTGGQTGTPGADGSNAAPNFQWTGAGGYLSTSALAANIAAAITPAEQTGAGITMTYTPGNSFLTITAASAGAAGNTITVGGTFTGFSWNPSGHLAGGNNQLTWTYQSASNGQTTAAEATGTSGIVIDNVGSDTGEANIYFGTLSGTSAANAAVKMTQVGLQ